VPGPPWRRGTDPPLLRRPRRTAGRRPDTLREQQRRTRLRHHKGPLTLTNDTLTLDVFLDRSVIEAYANDHKSITTRAYPFRQESLGLRRFGDGSTVKSVTVWKMGNMTD